jgi:hypothetical protein
MEKRRCRKHNALQRVLVGAVEHRPFFEPKSAATVATLEQCVADVATRLGQQAHCISERQTASDRCEAARRLLYNGLKLVAIVSARVNRKDPTAQVLDVHRFTSDDDLFAQADGAYAAASAHADLYVQEGIQPGLLERFAGEIEAFRKAKGALTLARQHFTEATEAIDQRLADGDEAVAVLEGVLATSADAPIGALAALRQAKRIGPREEDPAASTAEPTPAAAPPTVPEKVG